MFTLYFLIPTRSSGNAGKFNVRQSFELLQFRTGLVRLCLNKNYYKCMT